MRILKQKLNILFLLAALTVATGCSEKDYLPVTVETPEKDLEPVTVKIPEKEPEAEHPKDAPVVDEPVTPSPDNILAGTKWKLAGFVDVKTGEVKIPEPQAGDKVYILQFKTDGSLAGHSSTNDLTGTYSVDSSSGSIDIRGWTMTYAGELSPDGYRFLDALKGVYPYELLENELKLFENENFYLQFKTY